MAKHQASDRDDLPFSGPCKVSLTFTMPSCKKPKFPLPATKPDIDKLARSTLDALSGVIYTDDARIVDLHCKEVFGERPGVEVWVEEVTF